jgi:PAS domain S-box-containing protein
VSLNVSAVRDERGIILYSRAILRDITETKYAERKLRESENRFRTLIENLSVGVLLQGPHAEILLSNGAALSLLGLTEDQLRGKTSFDPDWNVIHEDGSPFPGPTHPVPVAIATLAPVRNVVMGVYRPAHHDRVWLLVNAEPECDSSGKLKQVLCTFNDITGRKQEEQGTRDREELYRLLTEKSSEMMQLNRLEELYRYVSDHLQQRLPDTLVLYVSIDEARGVTRLESISGLEGGLFNRILSISGFNPVGKEFRLVQQHHQYFRSGNLVQFPGGLADFAGGEFPETAARAIEALIGIKNIYTIGITKDEHLLGAIHFITFNGREILSREFIEAFVKQAGIIIQKKVAELDVARLLDEKDLLLKETHHRIKNNMQTVKAVLGLQARSVKDAAANAILKDSESRVASMMTLYDKLYRTEHPSAMSADRYISPLIDEIVEMFGERGGIHVEKDIEHARIEPKALSALGLILNELLSNSMKHAFVERSSGTIRVALRTSGKRIRLEVRDDGIGFTEQAGAVPEGTFGLNMVKTLVGQLGGSIRSEQNSGTSWTVEFDQEPLPRMP